MKFIFLLFVLLCFPWGGGEGKRFEVVQYGSSKKKNQGSNNGEWWVWSEKGKSISFYEKRGYPPLWGEGVFWLRGFTEEKKKWFFNAKVAHLKFLKLLIKQQKFPQNNVEFWDRYIALKSWILYQKVFCI